MAKSAEALFLENRPLIDQVIRFVCRRLAIRGDEAEEFAADVRLRLIASDYEILRKYQGRSSLSTYLSVVIKRLALDFRTAKWGKWRPCAAARAAGPVAVRLEQLVVRDEMRLEDALSAVERQFGEIDRAALQEVAGKFPLRTRRHYVGEEVLEFAASESPDAERLLVQDAEQARFERVAARLKAMIQTLEPSDRLALQLHFEQGLRIADVARMLQRDQKRMYRSMDQSLSRLRALLEAEGINAEGIRSMLATAEGGRGKPASPVRLLERNTP